MSFLGSLLGLGKRSDKSGHAGNVAPRTFKAPAAFPEPNAERIRTENVLDYANRIEREGRRKGDARLLQQARNLRARFGSP